MEVHNEASLVGGGMSIEMLNRALKVEGLTPTRKFILVLLGNYADENDQCYPSHRHIAKIIGLKDTKGIQRTIKEFEQMGYLKIQHRKKEDGSYTSNKYTLLLPEGSNTLTGSDTLKVTATLPVNTKDNTKTNNISFTLEDELKFKNFYKNYPRKVGKHITMQKYKQALKEVSHTDLEKAVIMFKTECEVKQTEKKYIPHPSTWLYQKRYIDYLEMKDKDFIKEMSRSKNDIAG